MSRMEMATSAIVSLIITGDGDPTHDVLRPRVYPLMHQLGFVHQQDHENQDERQQQSVDHLREQDHFHQREVGDQDHPCAKHDKQCEEPVEDRGFAEFLLIPDSKPRPSHTEYEVDSGRMHAAKSDALNSPAAKRERRTRRKDAILPQRRWRPRCPAGCWHRHRRTPQ